MAIPTIKEIVDNNVSINAPDYENNISTKMPGYNLVFYFPTRNTDDLKSKSIAFPAYIKDVSDNFSLSYDSKKVYGRMDPIPIYQGTTRKISFDLTLPSNGLAHSREIADKLNTLVQNLYPSYQKNGAVNVISSPPLVTIFFSNLIYDKTTDSSLLGYFDGGVVIKHDLTKGVFSRGEGYETYPKAYSLSFNFNVLHHYTPGFISGGSNPVNILRSQK